MPNQPKSDAIVPTAVAPAYHRIEQFRCLYDPEARTVTCEPFLRRFLQARPPHGPMVELTDAHVAGGGPGGLPKNVPIREKWMHQH